MRRRRSSPAAAAVVVVVVVACRTATDYTLRWTADKPSVVAVAYRMPRAHRRRRHRNGGMADSRHAPYHFATQRARHLPWCSRRVGWVVGFLVVLFSAWSESSLVVLCFFFGYCLFFFYLLDVLIPLTNRRVPIWGYVVCLRARARMYICSSTTGVCSLDARRRGSLFFFLFFSFFFLLVVLLNYVFLPLGLNLSGPSFFFSCSLPLYLPSVPRSLCSWMFAEPTRYGGASSMRQAEGAARERHRDDGHA